jgi:putative transcriptional regulator
MTAAEVKAIRVELGLTQVQIGQLLGVHPLTVSKWERDDGKPSPHQAAMLLSFRKARASQPDVGQVVAGLLVSAGVAFALYALLSAAFGEE